MLVVAVVAGVGRSHDLAAVGHSLVHVRWGLLLAALGLEAASMVVFALIQQRLLRAGNVEVGLGPMTAIALAANALALTLPGGVAWGATWVFGRLRRRGADRPLAGWVVLVSGALGSFALFLVVAAGIEIAGGRGPVAHLRPVAAGLAAMPVVAAGVALLGRRSPGARAVGRGVAGATSGMPHLRRLADAAGTLASRVGAVGLDVRGWTTIGLLAMLNWLIDCACLVTCVWAISGTVPWRGVLVAYGLAQVAASFPLVPGGLGVVEGSLSFFLVAYGMSAESALAGVFLYRIVSFWSVVPVGWGIWGCLTLREQRSRAVAPVQRPTPVTVSAAAAKVGSPVAAKPRRQASTSLTWCGSRLSAAARASSSSTTASPRLAPLPVLAVAGSAPRYSEACSART
ncbi:MAG TPA: YbhN family protein [Acidimicrobiales bacterium]|nr:YbhN family protein [Acidimicrobiales bacterium]